MQHSLQKERDVWPPNPYLRPQQTVSRHLRMHLFGDRCHSREAVALMHCSRMCSLDRASAFSVCHLSCPPHAHATHWPHAPRTLRLNNPLRGRLCRMNPGSFWLQHAAADREPETVEPKERPSQRAGATPEVYEKMDCGMLQPLVTIGTISPKGGGFAIKASVRRKEAEVACVHRLEPAHPPPRPPTSNPSLAASRRGWAFVEQGKHSESQTFASPGGGGLVDPC